MGEWNNREIEIITKEKCLNNPNGYRVGRKEECDLIIIRNKEISLFHLNILFEEGIGFMLQDNNEKGSFNGSYIAIRHSKILDLGSNPNLSMLVLTRS